MGFDINIPRRQPRSRDSDTANAPLKPIDASMGDSKDAGGFGYHTAWRGADGTIQSAIDATGRRVNFINGQAPERVALDRQQGQSTQPAQPARRTALSSSGDGSVGPSSASVALASAPSASDHFAQPGPGGSVGPSSASVALKSAPSVAERFSQPPPKPAQPGRDFPASPLTPEAASALRQAAVYDTTHPSDTGAGTSGPIPTSPPSIPPRKAATPTADPAIGTYASGSSFDTNRATADFTKGNITQQQLDQVYAADTASRNQQGAPIQSPTDAAAAASARRFPAPPSVNYGKLWQSDAPAYPALPAGATGTLSLPNGGSVTAGLPEGPVPTGGDTGISRVDENGNRINVVRFDGALTDTPASAATASAVPGTLAKPAADSTSQPSERPGFSTTLASAITPAATPYNPDFAPPRLQPGTPDNSNFVPTPGPATITSSGTRAGNAVNSFISGAASLPSTVGNAVAGAYHTVAKNLGDFTEAVAPGTSNAIDSQVAQQRSFESGASATSPVARPAPAAPVATAPATNTDPQGDKAFLNGYMAGGGSPTPNTLITSPAATSDPGGDKAFLSGYMAGGHTATPSPSTNSTPGSADSFMPKKPLMPEFDVDGNLKSASSASAKPSVGSTLPAGFTPPPAPSAAGGTSAPTAVSAPQPAAPRAGFTPPVPPNPVGSAASATVPQDPNLLRKNQASGQGT